MSARHPDLAEFQLFLQRCRRRFVLHTATRGLAVVLLVVPAVVLLCLAIDFVTPLPGSVRLVLLLLSAVVAGWVGWKKLVSPLLSGISDVELGAAADLIAPGLDEAVATVVSIESPDATQNEAGSRRMRERLQQQLLDRLKSQSSTAVMENRSTVLRCVAAILVLALAIGPLLGWQSGSWLLLQRFLTPLTSRATATNLYFTMEAPGDIAARGSDVVFRAVPGWRDGGQHEPPERAEVILTAASGHTDTLPLLYDSSSGNLIGTLRNITDSVTWRVESGRTATADYFLQVVDSPRQIAGSLTVTPPEYTGLPTQVYPNATGHMTAFEGSHLQLQLEFNKPVLRAELIWLDESMPVLSPDSDLPVTGAVTTVPEDSVELLEVAADGQSASLEFTADRGGPFRIRLLDEFQLTGVDETARHLEIIRDQAPQLSVSGVRSGDALRPDDILPVDCTAVDDVGIGQLELQLSLPDGRSEVLPFPSELHGQPDVVHSFRIDLKQRGLQDGDRLTFRVRATDERPSGAQEVLSEPFELTIDSDAAAIGTQALSEESRALLERLESGREQLEEASEAVRQLRRTPPEDWEHSKQDLNQLSEQQQLLGRELEQIAQQASEHPLMKSAADELEQLAESLRSQTGEQLQQARQQEYDAAGESLRQVTDQLHEARNHLNRIIRHVQRAGELEQDLAELNRLALDAEQLAADAADLRQREKMLQKQLPTSPDHQERREQLQAESEQIEQTRRDLSQNLTDLLQEQRELQAAAQQALRRRQENVASQAGSLAERQQQLSTLMEYEDAADPAQTAAAQQQIAQETGPLKDELTEIGRQVRLPGVGLEEQSSSVEAARQSAASAAEQAAAAEQEVRDGNSKEAAESGRDAASALQRVAQLGQQSDQQQSASMVPPEAGQSVTEALQNLTDASTTGEASAEADSPSSEANDAGQEPASDSDQDASESGDSKSATDTPQNSSDPDNAADAASDASDSDADASDVQPGDPEQAQPADGRAQQLADAAAALSAAAWASLPDPTGREMPQLPLPGRLPGTAPTTGESGGVLSGLLGQESADAQRDWARLNDELGQDIRSGDQEALDSRYASMIRAYFRELARVSSTSPEETP